MTQGVSIIIPSPMFSVIREKPGPEVAVMARAPLQAAPMIAETADDASAPDVETAPLDPVTTAAAAAIATAEASPAPQRPTPAAAPAPAESANGLRNPYIQIGLFSLEENADAAAASLRQAGIVPSVDPTTTNGKSFWRVLVGPLTSADDQAALLARVKDLGYSDAYLTAN